MQYHGLPDDKKLQDLFAKANAADTAAGLAMRNGNDREYTAQKKVAKRAWAKFFARKQELEQPKGNVSQITRKIS
jgi:hypothetical protein